MTNPLLILLLIVNFGYSNTYIDFYQISNMAKFDAEHDTNINKPIKYLLWGIITPNLIKIPLRLMDFPEATTVTLASNIALNLIPINKKNIKIPEERDKLLQKQLTDKEYELYEEQYIFYAKKYKKKYRRNYILAGTLIYFTFSISNERSLQ